MKKILALLFALSVLNVLAQNPSYMGRTSHWYFGYNCGLNFVNMIQRTSSAASGSQSLWIPTPTSSGPIETGEGCFAISDRTGNFLFASDGITVYNKNLVTMDNGTGLKGNPSATNSGIVVPFPGSTTKYYIFTTPEFLLKIGYFYNIVDLSENGGLGKVTTKNQQLTLTNAGGGASYAIADCYENIGAVGHTNGRDYWLISRVRNHFLVWPVTPAGIGNPVYYNIGVDLGIVGTAALGTIKISQNGKTIAHCNYSLGRLTLADFNPATGVVSSPKMYNTISKPAKLYGAEFSPNGRYLYVTCIESGGVNENGLYVLDLNTLTASTVFTRRLANICNVQLGPDGRIYAVGIFGVTQLTSLWVITNPDSGGTSIAEYPNTFSGTPAIVTPGRIRAPYYGLPTMITTYFEPGKLINKVPLCTGVSNLYKVEVTGDVGNISWDFGDGTPVQIDTSIGHNGVYHTYNNPGNYNVTVIFHSANTGLEISRSVMSLTIFDCVIKTNRTIRTDIKF